MLLWNVKVDKARHFCRLFFVPLLDVKLVTSMALFLLLN